MINGVRGGGFSSESGAGFDLLSPQDVLEAVEAAYGLSLDGRVETYPSYVNRVYGLRSEEGEEFVAKFYRPGRWSLEGIREEHAFVQEAAREEIPVVVPIRPEDGDSLSVLELEQDDRLVSIPFTLFPKRGGRSFDADDDSAWTRLGALTGRLHALGRRRTFLSRPRLGRDLAFSQLREIEALVHAELRAELVELVSEGLELALERLSGLGLQRIHGDLHRGNILDRPGEGLLLIDFDDCVLGPPVQDLWLLLPGRMRECGREFSLILEGYSEFSELEPGSSAGIEGLRFMRMLHFLAWRARQRHDSWFLREYPDWGGRAFWIQELEDFRDQLRELSPASLPGRDPDY